MSACCRVLAARSASHAAFAAASFPLLTSLSKCHPSPVSPNLFPLCSIGRTGRKTVDGYNEGTSISFFSSGNARLARDLAGILSEAGQPVPPRLMEYASLGGGGRSKFGGFGGGGRYGGGGGGGYGGGGGGRFGGGGGGFGGGRY